MSDLILSGIYIYPVKSLAGISLQQTGLDRAGLQHDRRWMLVDRDGVFLSQRRLPRMTLIRQQLVDDQLILSAAGRSDLHLPIGTAQGDSVQVEIWHDHCLANHYNEAADSWLSECLDYPCRLVYLPEDRLRKVDPAYAEDQDRTAFSDGYPLLLITEASLRDLNGRLDEALPMSRFRPNLVVAGATPYAEDQWTHIRIGELTFRVVKPCSRCIITTIDPTTAERGEEPLRTLAGFRRQGNKVMFGQNMLCDASGHLELGMPLKVLSSSQA